MSQNKEKSGNQLSLLVSKLRLKFINDNSLENGTSDGRKPVLVTIESLPVEVLDGIFEAYFDMEESVYKLTFVSKRWASIILANPRLWTFIRFGDQGRESQESQIRWRNPALECSIVTEKRWQICNTEVMLQKAISRSGSLPLQVEFRNRPDYPWFITPLLRKLFTPPISHRIQNLSMYDRSNTTASLMQQQSILELRSLTELALTETPYLSQGPFLKYIGPTAPHITCLSLSQSLDESILTLPIWADLQTLSLDPTVIPREVLSGIVQRCHKLVSFTSLSDSWPNSNGNVDTDLLVKIPQVHIRCLPHELGLLNLQHLETLRYRNSLPWGYKTPAHSATLPHLAALDMHSANSIQFLECWQMPRLSHLKIAYNTREDISPTFLITSFPTVTTFHLEMSRFHDCPPIASTFHFVPNVRLLSFIHLCRASEGCGSVKEMKTFARRGVGPSLQRVILGDHKNAILPPIGLSIHYIAKQIQKSRRKQGMGAIEIDLWLSFLRDDGRGRRVEFSHYTV